MYIYPTEKIDKILIIDDEETCIISTSLLLQNSGFKILVAKDANTALKILAEENIDLVVLDLMLPDIHGLDLLAQFKANLKLKDIPVIIHTGSSDFEEIKKAKDLGIVGFLKKPYSKEAFYKTLNRINKSISV